MLIVLATSFAIAFVVLTYLMPNYAMMWLSIEVIVLPVIYYAGYEILMEKQKDDFERSLSIIHKYVKEIEMENSILRFEK